MKWPGVDAIVLLGIFWDCGIEGRLRSIGLRRGYSYKKSLGSSLDEDIL